MHNEIDSFSLNIINPATFKEHKHLKKEQDTHPYITEKGEKRKAFLQQHIHLQSANNKCELEGSLKAGSLPRVLQ